MSAKFSTFEPALIALCRKHSVQLVAGTDMTVEARDLEAGDDPVFLGLEDRTKQDADDE